MKIDLSKMTQDPVLKRFFRNGPDAGTISSVSPTPIKPTPAPALEVA